MLPLVEFPELVQHYAPYFSEVFSAKALVEFERYISGLIVSFNKTVEGINRLFVIESRNQSSLNRLVTESPYSLDSLNQARLDLLNSLPGTRFKSKGVLSGDDTLLEHTGQDFEQIAILFDPVHNRFVWAHDLVTLHYSDDDTDYPVYFQLWKPADLEKIESGLRQAKVPLKEKKLALKETDPPKWRGYLLGVWERAVKKHPELADLYDTKMAILKAHLQRWVQEHPDLKLPVTFDNWFTQPAFCRYLDHDLRLKYVGTLTENDKVELASGIETLKEFAEQLKQEHWAALPAKKKPVFRPIKISYKGETERYYSYCNTQRIQGFGKQRLVINFRQADLSDAPHYLISNCFRWQSEGITRIRRHRWPVEVFHEEGKAEGLDQYQLRHFDAIQRHVALVAVVYSLLRAAQHDPALRKLLQRELEVNFEDHPAAWRRITQAQSLWCLGVFISTGLAQGQSLHQILNPLIQAVVRTS